MTAGCQSQRQKLRLHGADFEVQPTAIHRRAFSCEKRLIKTATGRGELFADCDQGASDLSRSGRSGESARRSGRALDTHPGIDCPMSYELAHPRGKVGHQKLLLKPNVWVGTPSNPGEICSRT
ncbi:hypothetical protein LIA77_09853 [Sarocladium implicatum]|nr:hypothetical protein LIA77_09853 [Sarocladium implicatum]